LFGLNSNVLAIWPVILEEATSITAIDDIGFRSSYSMEDSLNVSSSSGQDTLVTRRSREFMSTEFLVLEFLVSSLQVRSEWRKSMMLASGQFIASRSKMVLRSKASGHSVELASLLQLKVETDCKPWRTYGRCVEITDTRLLGSFIRSR
jgi:hypothetical protein